MRTTLVKKATPQKTHAKLYANENEYCSLYENYNPSSVDAILNVIGPIDFGRFNWDLAIWCWENQRETFFINLAVGCFQG